MRGPLATHWMELVALFVLTGVAPAVIRSERIISRRDGAVVVALSVAFTPLTVLRG